MVYSVPVSPAGAGPLLIGQVDDRADVAGVKHRGIGQALAVRLGQAPGGQRRERDLLRQRQGRVERVQILAPLGHGVQGVGPLRRLHKGQLGKLLHRLLGKARGGNKAVVVQPLLVQILLAGVGHGVLGDLQPREKADAQRHNQQQRQIPPPEGADGPAGQLIYCLHLITTRSRRWGRRRGFSHWTGSVRS